MLKLHAENGAILTFSDCDRSSLKIYCDREVQVTPARKIVYGVEVKQLFSLAKGFYSIRQAKNHEKTIQSTKFFQKKPPAGWSRAGGDWFINRLVRNRCSGAYPGAASCPCRTRFAPAFAASSQCW